MRIAIAHNAVEDGDAPDERDVLVQAEAVGAALETLGHEPMRLPCTLDLAVFKERLTGLGPDLVFNLVESLEGTGRLIHLVPFVLDALGISYSGARAEAILLTSHKVLAKERLAAAGVPTPPWSAPFPADLPAAAPAPDPTARAAPSGRWIVKSLWEHASVGLDEAEPLICDRDEEVPAALRAHAARFGGACFAERFVDGREFNLSLLSGADGPQVLAPAEIRFEDYPQGALRIVGYRAKWLPGSFEYDHTPRRFEFPGADAALLARLRALARRCWEVFGLRGYARVDFRVDAEGRPWVLEVNANPCLSPDAGFAAALAQTGVGFDEAIGRIVSDAIRE